MTATVALARRGAVLRRLEGTERMVAMGNAMFQACFNVVAMVEIEGPTTLAMLQEAVARVQHLNGCLKVEVADEPGRSADWVFCETDALARVEVVERTHPSQWREAWEALSHTRLEGLAWKLVWVRGEGDPVSQVLVAFHHSISDIRSLQLFFDGVLRALHCVHTGEADESRPVPLHGALHRTVKSRWPWAAMARCGWYRYFGRLRTVPFDLEAPVPLAQRRWGAAMRALAPDDVLALRDRCRAEGLTIGHVLSAATILELADRVRAREGLADFDVSLSTSLDLRRFPNAGVDPRQMGLLVAAVQTFYRPRAHDTAWTLARRVKVALDAVIARNEHRDFPRALNLVGPRTATWAVNQSQGRPAEGALVVSNFGRLEGLAHGAFKARRMFFTAAQGAWGSTLLLASGTLHGTMYLTLGHPSPALAESTGAALLDGLLTRVGTRPALVYATALPGFAHAARTAAAACHCGAVACSAHAG